MANRVIVKGFQPTGVMYGTLPFSVDSSNSGATFKGDVIDMESDGNVSAAAAASTQIIGSAAGVLNATTAQKALLPTLTAGTLICTWHKAQEYLCRGDSATVGDQTQIGNNANHSAGAGSTVTGWSGHLLDLTSITTSTSGFRILDFVLAPEEDETLASALARVVCNDHFLSTTTGV